ncbi:SpoIIE family protein phosphatase [Streptomyces sp. NPDC060184]|uniref:SpoIIE family protein phosphatase n=1 Tax=Streptomyces sp. NPDC060184 TaxID=3347064 RepID=UPI00364D82DB
MDVSPGTQDGPGPELDRAVLWALFSESPMGLLVLDPDLRLVRFNSAARHVDAVPLSHALGRHIADWAGDFYDDAVAATLRGVLDSGVPALDIDTTGHLTSEKTETTLSVSCFRLADEDGGVLGVAVAIVDVTDRQLARERLELIRRASGRIGTTLDIFRTAQELADELSPALADVVVVEVLDAMLRGEAASPGPVLENGPLRCAGQRTVPELEACGISEIGEVTGLSFATPFVQSMTDLRTRLVNRLAPHTTWLEREPRRGRHLVGLGAHSLMVLPLTARGVVLGLARCYRLGRAPAFDEEDLAVAAELADRAALCLDNARLYNRERSAAHILQLTLRPARVTDHPAVETAFSYRPFGPGGDWFDVIPLSGARVALVAGDTAGRGIRAAATMGEVRSAIGVLAVLDLPPDEVLERLHALVTRLEGEQRQSGDGDGEGNGDEGSREGTCLYMVYDPVSRRCTMASAGHPAPVLAHPDGTVEYAGVPTGPPLGRGMPDYRTTVVELPEGCVVTLANAALLRTASGTGEERLAHLHDALLPSARPLQEICDALLYTLAPERADNDAVLLLARTRVLGPDRVGTWTLPNDPAAVAGARASVEGRLAAWGLEAHAFTAVLVVSELVTNAVRYSHGDIGLRLVLDGTTLVCEVTDDSSTAPHLRHAEAGDEGGRGLSITSQLSTRWGTRPEKRGKTIWAEVPLSDEM